MKFYYAVALSLITLLAGLSPANATEEILVSEDGVVWKSSISDPLFNTPIRWVPGDNEIRNFWVKNNASSQGVWVMHTDGLDSALFSSGAIEIKVRVNGGAWKEIDESNRTLKGKLPKGESTMFEVNAVFSESSTNPSQNETLPLSFRFEVSEDTSLGNNEEGLGDKGGDSGLGRTGASLLPNVVCVGFMISLLGALLVATSRRKREDEEGIKE